MEREALLSRLLLPDPIVVVVVVFVVVSELQSLLVRLPDCQLDG
jgi:hypothetical protein